MNVPGVLLILLIVYLAAVIIGWFVVVPILRRGPGGTAINGLMWRGLKVYCRVWHRARYYGRERLPGSDDDHNGLIVVSNHTGSADPLLIQSGCRFHIRWLMATDTMLPQLGWLWRQQDVIPVERDGNDSSALRGAIRHVRRGGCVGIFPEGRIAVPPREIRPFFTGVGAVIARTGAPVLLVWISGTPDTPDMMEALRSRGRARVRFLEVIDFGDEKDAERITASLRQRLAEESGWPLNDELRPPGQPEWMEEAW